MLWFPIHMSYSDHTKVPYSLKLLEPYRKSVKGMLQSSVSFQHKLVCKAKNSIQFSSQEGKFVSFTIFPYRSTIQSFMNMTIPRQSILVVTRLSQFIHQASASDPRYLVTIQFIGAPCIVSIFTQYLSQVSIPQRTQCPKGEMDYNTQYFMS